MLAKQDFRQMQDYIIQVLPQLLRQNPEIATTIEGMLAHQFPRRDEFTQLLNEMKSLREESNRRFDKVDHRFEEVKREQLDLKRRMVKVESTVDRMDKKITQFDAWLKVVTGNVGDKKGKDAKQLFALGLNYGLKRSDIKPESIQLRQTFMDDEGIVFPRKGKHIEVDILAENGNFAVFEVKTTAIDTDVVTFARKIQLIQHQTPDKQVSGIFIAPNADEEIAQCCSEYGLMFVG